MDSGIRSLEQAYEGLFTGVLIVLAVLVIFCLIRAIIGPGIADRIVAVNMTGTMVIVIIAVLALMQGEGYLADICIIYAMISFLTVIVLTKVYMGVYLKEKETKREEEAGKTEAGSLTERKPEERPEEKPEGSPKEKPEEKPKEKPEGELKKRSEGDAKEKPAEEKPRREGE